MSAFDPQAVAEKIIESRVDDLLNEDQQFQISVNIKQLATMTGSSVSTLETTFVPLSYVQELQRRLAKRAGNEFGFIQKFVMLGFDILMKGVIRMDLFYYYVGECVSWFGLISGAMFLGFKLSESVHDMGGWKAWAMDFFGLEDHK
ncbi:hypothetical protein UCCLBBS449_1589 [Levilactobacillus brevis]|uniref:Uncharacterized protein n=3 Tax=Levilactobacillus brevis TaxID=1580 RepID=A0A5B7Y0J0_LEVBR|nr:hypothetical protein [Levilactobacillus brevis]QCZ53525.1 hypothetical protein UCCLBBS449_1589 [Levilactobacillus brevis]